jgi:hypothetical protein
MEIPSLASASYRCRPRLARERSEDRASTLSHPGSVKVPLKRRSRAAEKLSMPSESRDQDSAWLDDLVAEGIVLGETRLVTQFFSFPLNRDGALGAGLELQVRGWDEVVVEEERDGAYWFVAAFRLQLLTPAAVSAMRDEMEDIARRYEGVYGGWDVTRMRFNVPYPPNTELYQAPRGWVQEVLVDRAKAAGEPVLTCVSCEVETVDRLAEATRWRYWPSASGELRPYCRDCTKRRLAA